MSRTVLLTGITGTVGQHLLGRITPNHEFKVKALVRRDDVARTLRESGVDAYLGDLDDPSTLGPAFEGVDTLWLVTSLGPRAPENSMNALWAARQAGVRSVLRLSAIGAAHDAPTRNGRLHALSDVDVMASGMEWTILRPHFYMQNLFGAAGSIAGAGAIYLNMGESPLGMIDVRDIADVVAAILAHPESHYGQIYTPTGPESITIDSAAAAIGTAVGKKVTYVAVPPAAAQEAMIGSGLPPWFADAYVEYGEAYASGWGDFTTDDVAKVVGHAPRSINEFATDFVEVFTAASKA